MPRNSVPRQPGLALIENRKKRIMKKFSLTSEDYDLLITHYTQCGICGIKFSIWHPPHFDHDHSTTRLRGLLCYNCNVGLGHFQDKIVMLQSAIEYLKKGGKLY